MISTELALNRGIQESSRTTLAVSISEPLISTAEDRLRQIGNRVRTRRMELGLRQWEAGSGHQATVSQIESGRIRPSLRMLGVLYQTLGLSSNLILFGSEIPIKHSPQLLQVKKKAEKPKLEEVVPDSVLKSMGTLIRKKRKELYLSLDSVVGRTQAPALSRVERGLIRPSEKLIELIVASLGLNRGLQEKDQSEKAKIYRLLVSLQAPDRRLKSAHKKAVDKVTEEPKFVFVPQRFPDIITTTVRGVKEITVFSAPKPPVTVQEVVGLGRKCEPFLIAMKNDRAIERELGNSNGMKITLLSMSNIDNGQPCLKVETSEGIRILDLSDAIRIYGYGALTSFFENPPVWKLTHRFIKVDKPRKKRR